MEGIEIKEWKYNLLFDIGDMVKFKANKYSKSQGMIVGIGIRAGNSITYEVAWDDFQDRWHYEVELELIVNN